MFCSKCGNNLPDEAKFCDRCGNPVKSTEGNGKTSVHSLKENGKSKKGILIASLVCVGIVTIILLGLVFSGNKDTYVKQPNKIVHYHWTDEIIPTSWFEYEYDEQGNVLKEIRYYGDDEIAYWYEYEYDEQGNVLKRYFWENGEIGAWYEYEYDEQGKESKEIVYDEEGEFLGWYEYEYDEQGNVLKKFAWSEGELLGWYEYEYDEQGNRLKEYEVEGDGICLGWYEYEYDEQGNVLKINKYIYKDLGEGDIQFYEWYEYVYDEQNEVYGESILYIRTFDE